MPLQQMPTYKSNSDRIFEIPNPGIGGLNLKDIEYEQESTQSPYMLNMMYRNGSFGKRYGQSLFFNEDFDSEVLTTYFFNESIFMHVGTTIYSVNPSTTSKTVIASNLPNVKGIFLTYAQTLYYICNKKIYNYKYKDGTWSWGEIEPYIPEVLINCDPAGPNNNGNSDTIDDYNIIGLKFKEIYHGDGESKDFYIYGDEDNIIDWTVKPTIEIDGDATTDFTVDSTNKKITFTKAPSKGNLNVEITLSLKESAMGEDRDRVLSAKYWATFGGNNNGRLFLAGVGDSKYYFSESYDVTYFPENNWATIGNDEDDITGFGLQYNVLIIFKPHEMYSIYSYTQTSSNTIVEDDYGKEAFKALQVNPNIGCDCPYTIQLINNQLTWLNSVEGVCTLVSTNIQDERNVRAISRNVDRGNNMGLLGISEMNDAKDEIQSCDFDSKYFLIFPKLGYCYMWDYEISPFYYTSSKVTDTKTLTWFLFDHFFVKEFIRVNKQMLFISSDSRFNKNLVRINESLIDLDFDGDGKLDNIEAYYMTSFMQFNAVSYLKNVRNLYVQCRGDTSSSIDIYYYTEESASPEQESESIETGGKNILWQNFAWGNFSYLVNAWGQTYRRRCGLKKIQRVAFLFKNPKDKFSNNIAITYLGMDYQLVRQVK